MHYRLTVLIAVVSIGFASASAGHEPVSVVLTYDLDGCGSFDVETIDLSRLATAINKRLGNAGNARQVENKQIQVDVYGELDKPALDSFKRRVSGTGCLELRILADTEQQSDVSIIKQARREPANKKQVLLDGKKVAEWIPYKVAEFGMADQGRVGIVKRLAADVPEALVLIDDINVTGEYLASAVKRADSSGRPAIHFSLNEKGAQKLKSLTSAMSQSRIGIG